VRTRSARPPAHVKRKVLLVDDDAAVRESLTVALTDEGYSVLPAADAAQALQVAASTAVDLVLLDLQLPRTGGWEVLRRLTDAHPYLAIIIITARPNQLFTAVSAGAGALLEKPLSLPDLLCTMRRLIDEPRDLRYARLAGQAAAFEYRAGRPAAPPHLAS
jgi:DNA-binding response OmpR family regulator